MTLTQLQTISLLMIGSSILALLLSLHAWRRRYNNAFLPMSLLMASVAVWSFCYGLQLVSTNLTQMNRLTMIYYIGIAAIPVFWLMFAARYTGNDGWLTPLRTKLLFCVPLLSVIMIVTNDYHHLFLTSTELSFSQGHAFVQSQLGPFWWLHSIYSYFALLLGSIMLVGMFFKVLGSDRLPIAIFLAGWIFPIFANVLYIIGLRPWALLILRPWHLYLPPLYFQWASSQQNFLI